MSLIVEDGSGLGTANSLARLDEADAYHAERGQTDWAGADESAREAALIRGSAFLCRHYSWRGYRLSPGQALCWPRMGVLDDEGWPVAADIVPPAVRRAACEAALRELSASLDPDLPRGGRIAKEKVDALEVAYSSAAPAGSVYPVINGLVAGLIRSAPKLRRV
jgi:hypothetical protein